MFGLPYSQVLKKSVSTKYVRTMTGNHRSTLTTLTRNFDASECKLIFDDQLNDTEDNKAYKKNKKGKSQLLLVEQYLSPALENKLEHENV